jgi:hypothetical protein
VERITSRIMRAALAQADDVFGHAGELLRGRQR